MTSNLRISAPRPVLLLLVALSVAMTVVPAQSSAAQSGGEQDGKVFIFSFPRLTWERLDEVDTPVIDELLGSAALASMSTRTVGARTTPAKAYLTIGAGNRTTAPSSGDVGGVLNPAESTETGSAAEVFERRLGVAATGQLLGIDFASVIDRNDELLYGSTPGSMGAALREAGIAVAGVANADEGFGAEPRRDGALAVLDDDGQAPLGEVAQTLLVADPAAPGGIRMDPLVTLAASGAALDAGAGLLLVEMSDLERAEQARAVSTSQAADDAYDLALERADQLLGGLLAQVDPDPDSDMVMLVAPTAPLSGEELTVYALSGPDTEAGWARSSTTRRDGYVSLADLASTALGHLGVETGDGMSDTPVTTSADSTGLDDKVSLLIRSNDRAVFRDDVVGPLTVSFIVLLVVMLVLVAIGSVRGPSWSPWLRYLALLVMAVPACTYLGGLLPYSSFGVVTYGLALLAMAAVVSWLCLAASRGDHGLAPVLVAAATIAVLAIDILTGGHLQLDTIFGYSPIVAGRFAGFGNQAFSLISVSSLLVACGLWSAMADRGRERGRLPLVLALFAVVVVLVGAPTLGSDVGGVLASVPAFAVCVLLLTGRRIRWGTAALIAVGTVAVLALFAAIDLSRPPESRTHLGRFAERLIDGEGLLILERKLNANLSVLTTTVWTWVIPAALLFFVYLTWRPNNVLRQINAAHPTFRTFGISAITLGLVAWALNDSGVSMPAMMLAVALPYTAVLAIRLRGSDP